MKTPALDRRPLLADAWEGTSAREALEKLRRRARGVHARGRVAETLYSLALDLAGDDGRLTVAERQWLAEALAGPVGEAAHEAVDILLRELALTIGAAPPRLRGALAANAPVSRIDFE